MYTYFTYLAPPPLSNFNKTFYLTAVRTRGDVSSARVSQTIHSVDTTGVSGLWIRSWDGAGGAGWLPWIRMATTEWVEGQNYLTTIPSASQAVLGGVKVYTDSSGYLCIDTE